MSMLSIWYHSSNWIFFKKLWVPFLIDVKLALYEHNVVFLLHTAGSAVWILAGVTEVQASSREKNT